MMISNIIQLVCAAAAALFCGGCGKYNYEQIFPLDRTIRERSVQVKPYDCFECAVTPEEFEAVKRSLEGKFDHWEQLSVRILYCGHLQIGCGYYGLTSKTVLFAMGKGLDGGVPAVVYFPEAGKMLYFICDGML